VCENGRPPYWNFTLGFEFDLLIAFYIGVPNLKFLASTVPEI